MGGRVQGISGGAPWQRNIKDLSMANNCDGYGNCFIQTEHGFEQAECNRDCSLQKCPNYMVCKEILPAWVLNCHHRRCSDCNITFGANFEFHDNEECPICYGIKLCVKQPQCVHLICIGCFKKLYYRDDIRIRNVPQFPLPEDIETLYDENREDPRLLEFRFILEQYELDNDEYERIIEEDYEGKENICKCPLCRSEPNLYPWGKRIESS